MTARRLILGTAGHIDHGKTTLIRALSGVDCDRLPEEKARGITIELGFAPLDLQGGVQLGVVDVPGHERLVRTMVAGATGIDMALFVVAADEGIMPQSREHLAICDLLGIEVGVVALTKADLVDDDLLELARLEIEEELEGTSLAGAEIVPVSATTGRGLDELRDALARAAERCEGRTPRDGPAWLCVDRAFSVRGFGTVVTGTLRGGALQEGQSVELLPEGGRGAGPVKIRGIEVHGEAVPRAEPGSRCALNLQGVEVDAVPRGSVLASAGRVDYRPRVEVELRVLPDAPPLADGTSVTVHVGTSERRARVLVLDGGSIEPGESGFAQLRFERPVVALEGDRIIVRGFQRLPDAGWTLGGGRILDVAPARRGRGPDRADALEAIRDGEPAVRLEQRLRRAGARGATEEELRRELRSLDGLDRGVAVGGGRWLDRDAFARLQAEVCEAVAAHHAEVPTDPFAGFAAVRARVSRRAPDEAVRAALDACGREGRLETAGSGYRLAGHEAHAADPAVAGQVLERIRAAGLGPDTQESLAAQLGHRRPQAPAGHGPPGARGAGLPDRVGPLLRPRGDRRAPRAARRVPRGARRDRPDPLQAADGPESQAHGPADGVLRRAARDAARGERARAAPDLRRTR